MISFLADNSHAVGSKMDITVKLGRIDLIAISHADRNSSEFSIWSSNE